MRVSTALGDAAISYASGDNKNSVTQNIGLATTADFENHGTAISWSSNAPSNISDDNNGTVTRPAFNHSSVDDQTVTLTATISKGTESDTTTFTLKVIEAEPTDQEAVDAVWGDFDDLDLSSKITYASGDSVNSVTQDLNLATSTGGEMYGCTISWSSTDTSVVEADGTVHRPVYLDGDKAATLSVTVTKNSATNGPNEIETVTVIKAAMTDDVAVSLAKEALVATDISYAAGDSAASVTQNITLPTSGENGTTISWGSSNTGAIAISGSTGSVTRPDCGSGNATVTLTATISKGAESDTKTFSVTVIEKEPVDVTISAIEGIEIPVAGATPVATITGTSQYTGTVSWSPSVSTFQNATIYTATVSLTCATGYTYTNLASNFFTVEGAESVSFNNSNGVITAEFPTTVYPAGYKKTFTLDGVDFKLAYVPVPEGGLVAPCGHDFIISSAGYLGSECSSSYWVAETEVTYELWQKVKTWAQSNGYSFKSADTMGYGSSTTNQHPVLNLYVADIIVWCNALTECYNAFNGTSLETPYNNTGGSPLKNAYDAAVLEKSSSDGNGFRMLSVMEWNVAARWLGTTAPDTGGTIDANALTYKANGSGIEELLTEGYYWTPRYYMPGGINNVTVGESWKDYAWFSQNSDSKSHPVAEKEPNMLGLYDMAGNALEWTITRASVNYNRYANGGSFTWGYGEGVASYTVWQSDQVVSAQGGIRIGMDFDE